jgi:CMP-N,N'-diacetyllegionaminic acid synthase
MDIYAIIPARGGSKGVPKKNIKSLGGFPLIAYSIAAAKMCSEVKKIIVSTDCKEIAKIALHFGAEVPFLRPENISKDISSDLEFMLHTIHWLKQKKQSIPKYWAHLRPTTPLRNPEIIRNAFNKIIENENATSLRSAHECPESPFKWFLKDVNNEYFKPLAGQENHLYLNSARQFVPKAYIPNGYIDILISENILNDNSLHGDKIIAFESPSCTEIDTLEDFEYLEYQIQYKKFETFEYLKNTF